MVPNNSIKSCGILEKDLDNMVRQTRNMYKSYVHLGCAFSVPILPLFKGDEFGLLVARIMAMKLRGHKR